MKKYSMIPLYDEAAPALKPPYLTLVLILINVLIFAFVFLSTDFENIILKYGAIPSQVFQGKGFLTLLTSMFLHGGIIHLLGNMWFLWLFGDNVEYNLGPVRFIIFYLGAGLIAALIHVLAAPSEHLNIPMVGASGAISGLLGGYVTLFPRNKIRVFILLLFRPLLFSLPAALYVGIWFFYQLLYIGAPTSIAYAAHIGGFVGGIILILLLKRGLVRKDYSEIFEKEKIKRPLGEENKKVK